MPFYLGIRITLVSFLAEYVDATLGMGYGTTLTPLLLLMGFSPLEVVPSILLSQFLAGIFGGIAHHQVGNAYFKPKSFHPGKIITSVRTSGIRESFSKGIPRHLKIVLLLSAWGLVGTVSAVMIAVRLPKFWLTLYIGCLIFAIGVLILFSLNRRCKFSWKKMSILGLVASFNKGISAGGYGPIITGGQLLVGIDPKNAVGITTLTEGLICFVGVLLYTVSVPNLDWKIAPYNVAGALLSVPFAAVSVKLMNMGWIKTGIGILTVVMGLLTIFKTVTP